MGNASPWEDFTSCCCLLREPRAQFSWGVLCLAGGWEEQSKQPLVSATVCAGLHTHSSARCAQIKLYIHWSLYSPKIQSHECTCIFPEIIITFLTIWCLTHSLKMLLKINLPLARVKREDYMLCYLLVKELTSHSCWQLNGMKYISMPVIIG